MMALAAMAPPIVWPSPNLGGRERRGLPQGASHFRQSGG